MPLPPKQEQKFSERQLRAMIENGLADAVQQLLDINPTLQFKIEYKEGVPTLVDMVTGAALWLKRFITEDPDTIEMKNAAMKASKMEYEVLIYGETGTGKELIAQSMIGDRTGAFLSVNCAGLPENLIESELFGHVAGAFTGAIGQRQGMMAAAKEGVFFLDEIGELPLQVQGKLLRALQTKKVRMVGDKEEKPISCRFVSASNKNIPAMVKQGLFRADLYARVSTLELDIKPLRNRKCDIIPILKYIGDDLRIENEVKEFLVKYERDITNDTLDLSLNVRSLERAIKRFHTWKHI